jgi:hypothetical protein
MTAHCPTPAGLLGSRKTPTIGMERFSAWIAATLGTADATITF